MAKMSNALLAWRRKQPRGAIMKPETFDKIAAQAKKRGAIDPKRVAGRAYWDEAKRKFAGAMPGGR